MRLLLMAFSSNCDAVALCLSPLSVSAGPAALRRRSRQSAAIRQGQAALVSVDAESILVLPPLLSRSTKTAAIEAPAAEATFSWCLIMLQ